MDGTAVYNLLLRRLGLGLLSKGGRGGEAAAPPPPQRMRAPEPGLPEGRQTVSSMGGA